jgi:RNA polymerase sigma-70 factor (ECF subfamily)
LIAVALGVEVKALLRPTPLVPACQESITAEGVVVKTETGTSEVVLIIDRDFDDYTEEEQERLLQAVKQLIGLAGVLRVVRKRRGSVLLTLELTQKQIEHLRRAVEAGDLAAFGVVGIRVPDDEEGFPPGWPGSAGNVPAETTATRPSSPGRLANAEDLWGFSTFVDVYGPTASAYCRRMGLSEENAAEVTQECYRRVARSIHALRLQGDAGDHTRGGFRNWLLAVTRIACQDFLYHASHERQGQGDDEAWVHLPAYAEPPDEGQAWDQDYRAAASKVAIKIIEAEVERRTWQAFQRTAIGNDAAEDVAADLGMSVNAVYVAKSRVLDRLREVMKELDADIP